MTSLPLKSKNNEQTKNKEVLRSFRQVSVKLGLNVKHTCNPKN